MKKVWLILLAVVLAFGLVIGCGGNTDDDDDEGGARELVTVFDLAEHLTDIPVGTTDFVTIFGAKADRDSKVFWAAGEADANPKHVEFEVVAVGDGKGLKVTSIATWGAGIDIQDSAAKFFGGDATYPDGDKVSFTGKAETKIGIEITTPSSNLSGDGGGTCASFEAGDEINMERVLSADDVTKIRGQTGGDSPKALRIKLRDPTGTIILDSFKVEGYRATGHVAVTDITMTRTEGFINEAYPITGTVEPGDATNQTITWIVKSGTATFGTGDKANELTATAVGNVVITGTVKDGKKTGEDFTKDFTIAFTEKVVTAVNATVYLNNGATKGADGYVIGGSGYKELPVVFDKNLKDCEVEINFTLAETDAGLNISPALKTNVPFTDENGWGGSGAADPQYGKAPPQFKWTPDKDVDILKLSTSNAGEGKLVITSIKVDGETVTLTEDEAAFSTYTP